MIVGVRVAVLVRVPVDVGVLVAVAEIVGVCVMVRVLEGVRVGDGVAPTKMVAPMVSQPGAGNPTDGESTQPPAGGDGTLQPSALKLTIAAAGAVSA